MQTVKSKVIPLLLVLSSLYVLGFISWYAYGGWVEQKDRAYDNFSGDTNSSINLPRIALADVCDCYALAGETTPNIVVNTETGQEVTYPPLTTSTTPFNYVASAIPPSGRGVVMITHGGTTVEYARRPGEQVKTLYTVQTPLFIYSQHWSADENYLILGIGTVGEGDSGESILPRTIVRLRVSDSRAETIIIPTDLQSRSIESIFPLVVAEQASKILFSSGGQDEERHWIWTLEGGLRQLQKNFIGSVYFAAAYSPAQALFLTYFDGLHVFDLRTESEQIYPITGWSDSPVSQPSPDGRFVVYLKEDKNLSGGYLTIISLETGEELRLSNNAVGQFGSLAGSFWSADGQYFIYNSSYQQPFSYFVVETTLKEQTPKSLVIPSVLQQSILFRLIPK